MKNILFLVTTLSLIFFFSSSVYAGNTTKKVAIRNIISRNIVKKEVQSSVNTCNCASGICYVNLNPASTVGYPLNIEFKKNEKSNSIDGTLMLSGYDLMKICGLKFKNYELFQNSNRASHFIIYYMYASNQSVSLPYIVKSDTKSFSLVKLFDYKTKSVNNPASFSIESLPHTISKNYVFPKSYTDYRALIVKARSGVLTSKDTEVLTAAISKMNLSYNNKIECRDNTNCEKMISASKQLDLILSDVKVNTLCDRVSEISNNEIPKYICTGAALQGNLVSYKAAN